MRKLECENFVFAGDEVAIVSTFGLGDNLPTPIPLTKGGQSNRFDIVDVKSVHLGGCGKGD